MDNILTGSMADFIFYQRREKLDDCTLNSASTEDSVDEDPPHPESIKEFIHPLYLVSARHSPRTHPSCL